MPHTHGGQVQVYCSKLCAVRFRRGNKPRQMWPLTCAHCKAGFESLFAKAMYCSNRCKQAGWSAANPDKKYRYPSAPPTLCAYFTGYCGGCGCALGGRRAVKKCGGCARQEALLAGREASLAMNVAKHKAAGKVVTCDRCGLGYCPFYGVKLSATCPACEPLMKRERRKAAKDLRAKRIKTGAREMVFTNKVFERDGWLCRLCGIPTPKSLRGTYEHNAPELDHVLPLSRGGSHTYANTQCLCRSCNGWKRDRTMDEVVAALAA